MPPNGFHLSTAGLCALLLGLFHLGVWLLPAPPAPMEGFPPPARDHWPALRLQAAGLRVDVDVLRKSLLRLPSTALLRQASNSLRLACGEFPAWMFYAHHREPTYYLHHDVMWTEGLTPANREAVERAADVIGELNRHFREENWKLVVLPVPTKINVYRENVDWPLRELDPLNARTIPGDRTDEVCDLLFARLAQAGVLAVDLRAPFREVVTARDGRVVFPPGESHWSGLGLQIAADKVADALASLRLPTMPSQRAPVPYLLGTDIDTGLDHLAAWPPSLRALGTFADRIERGGKPDPGPDNLRALVAVAGTSYTGQYSWTGDAGLANSLDGRLPNAIIRSYAEAGRGSLRTAQSFIEQKSALLREMAAGNGGAHHLTYDQKYLVWEFPVRDLLTFGAPPGWIASTGAPLVGSDAPTEFVFGEGFQREETSEGAAFRWARQKATLRVNVAGAGRYRLILHPITMFSTAETVIAVGVNGRFAGALSTRACDFKQPAAESVEVTMTAGENVVTLESNRDEHAFGPTDLRLAAFGLVLPVELEGVP